MANPFANTSSKPPLRKGRISNTSASTTTSREPTPAATASDSLTAGRTRSRTQAAAPIGSFEDALGALDSDPKLNTLEEARALLARAQYIPDDSTSVTTSQLATTLLILIQAIAVKAGKTHVAHLRAVALMLHHEDTTCTAQLIASKVMDTQELILQQLQSATEKMNTAASALFDATNGLDQQMTTLARQDEATRESVQDLATAVNVMNNAADELLARSTDPATSASPTAQEPGPAAAPATSPSPAAPLTPVTAQAHATARAKAQADERNIILDLDGEAVTGVAKLSEQELVERANVAIDRMSIQAGDKPEQFAFAAAFKLEHGGIRYRMADKASADWLRKPDVRVAFAAAFGGDGRLKDRTYSVIAEFADIAFDPTSADGLKAVARLNAIPDCIASARWLKRAGKRRPGQRTAFLEVLLTTPKSANTIIRSGCVIHGRTLRTRKRLTEPKRCMKCNRFTSRHTAKTCKAEHDTCTKCAGEHREEACTSTTLSCINCKGEHAASDRACPRYLDEMKKIRDRVPDNKYPFYPEADDPSTWVQETDTDGLTSTQATGTPAAASATDGWRTVGPRGRGRRPGAAPSQRPKSAAGAAHRSQSRSQTRPAPTVSGTPNPTARPGSPLRQQTLHEVALDGILPGTPRPRANSASAATPTRPHA
jgi:hypothetical protein